MSHVFTLSDERYQAIAAVAARQGQTPDEVVASLVDSLIEHECAPYDEMTRSAHWQAMEQEANLARAENRTTAYASTEELFRALGADNEMMERARAIDGMDSLHADL